VVAFFGCVATTGAHRTATAAVADTDTTLVALAVTVFWILPQVAVVVGEAMRTVWLPPGATVP
jgi:hypothetical protein